MTANQAVPLIIDVRGDEAARRQSINALAHELAQASTESARSECYRSLVRLIGSDIKAGIFSVGVPTQDIDAVHADVNLAVWNERTGESQRWPRDHTLVGLFRGSFSAYVRGIARNLARDHLRRSSRRAPEVLQAEVRDIPISNDDRHEDRALLQELLDQLDDREREVVVMRGMLQMTFPEMADELDEAETAIKARFYRACTKLKRANATGGQS